VIYIEFFPYCLFFSNSQVIGCEDRLQNDLYCVGLGVKLYSIQLLKNSLNKSQSVARIVAAGSSYNTVSSDVRIVFFHFESNIGLLFEISNRIE